MSGGGRGLVFGSEEVESECFCSGADDVLVGSAGEEVEDKGRFPSLSDFSLGTALAFVKR